MRFHDFHPLTFAINVLVTFVLCYLTYFHAKHIFVTYRHLIASYSLIGTLFSGLDFMVQAQMHINQACIMVFTDFTIFGSLAATEYLIGYICGLFTFSISFLMIQFIYRYWAIFDVPKLLHFYGWKIWIWLSFPVFSGIFWTMFVFLLAKCDGKKREIMREPLNELYSLNSSNIACLSALIVKKFDSNRTEVQFRDLILLTCFLINTMFGYGVIINRGMKISQGMSEKFNQFSAKVRALHIQYFRSLIIQIVVPSIILVIPVIIVMFAVATGAEINLSLNFILFFVATYPCIDAIIILLVVSEYKYAVKKIFGRHIKVFKVASVEKTVSKVLQNEPVL